MALHLTYGIKLINPKANIDEHYGPYMSVEAANAAVPIAIRAVGRTVGILDSETNKITEYWWQCGIADDNLVEKTADVALLHALSTSKADKVTGATNGDIAGLDANGNLKDSGKSINDFKLKQQNVVDPTASGESITFIDSISQNEDGVIAPIKKTVKTATSASGDVPAAAGLMSSSDKSKLDSIANGAQVNVIEGVKVNGQLVVPDSDKNVNVTIQNPDWNQTTSAESDYILNKPAIKAGQGENSIIEGDLNGNSSTGNYSHTEGGGTTASGENSHSEGSGTTASGENSHAEGYNTTARGYYGSHAEGRGTTASGTASHVEGTGAKANGYASHAEGNNTTASGNYSHAEGSGTTTSGENSHAEGYGTTATHKSQHVFGEHNIADPSLNNAFVRGNYIEIVGNGAAASARSNARTLDWDGNETLAGNLTIGGIITSNGQQILPQKQSDWNQSDSESQDFVKNRPFYEDIAGELVVSGIPVNGAIYFDWGEFVPVVGKSYPIEWGTDNDGGGIIEQGTGVRIAQQSTQYSPDGVSIGFNQGYVFYNPDSFSAEGHNVNGKLDVYSDVRNIRIIDSVLQKLDAKFIDGHMAAGTGANSNKFNAVATNVASGDYSHAEGYNTTASGYYSHAEGIYTTASGHVSHAEGNNTTASGDNSHAEGGGTTASGSYSHAEGYQTRANHKSQHVFGEYNIADPSTRPAGARGNYVEIVGNGTFDDTRSNARTLDWQGNEVLAGTITANGINISEAISTVKFRVNGGSLQASVDGGLSWHTINFAD
jgi:hypothetical protein